MGSHGLYIGEGWEHGGQVTGTMLDPIVNVPG